MNTCSTGCKVCYQIIGFTDEQLKTDDAAMFRWRHQVCEDHEQDERRKMESDQKYTGVYESRIYPDQRTAVLNDERYSPAVKEWMISQLDQIEKEGR